MFEILDKYLLGSNRMLYKVFFGMLILIVLYLSNTIFGFTYSFEQKRLESIEKIAQLLANPDVDSITKTRLRFDMVEISNDKGYANYFFRSLYNLRPNSNISVNRNDIANSNDTDSNIFENISSSPLSFILNLLSNAYFPIWLLIISIRERMSEAGRNKRLSSLLTIISCILTIVVTPIFTNWLYKITNEQSTISKFFYNVFWQFLILVFFYVLSRLITFRFLKTEQKNS